jgi:hypothetical protein
MVSKNALSPSLSAQTPDAVLIDAARYYARRTAGQGVQRIALTLADGSKRKLDVPLAAAGDGGDWPPDAGWGYRGDEFAYNGQLFRLTGKAGKVLRALIDAGDEPLTLADLKAAVWDEWTDDRSVQNTVSKVRKAVADHVEEFAAADPIEASEGGYRLMK